jgi:hypothetical protein
MKTAGSAAFQATKKSNAGRTSYEQKKPAALSLRDTKQFERKAIAVAHRSLRHRTLSWLVTVLRGPARRTISWSASRR